MQLRIVRTNERKGLKIDCADLGLTRTPGRTELLYPRSKLVTTAKAFGLQAIDLVRPLINGVDGRYV